MSCKTIENTRDNKYIWVNTQRKLNKLICRQTYVESTIYDENVLRLKYDVSKMNLLYLYMDSFFSWNILF